MHFGQVPYYGVLPCRWYSMKRYLITRAEDLVFSVVIVTYAKVKLAQGELEVLSPGLSSGAG